MSLQVKNKITPNNSNRNVVFSETTGVYSGTNPGGYGYTQSPTGYRLVSSIDSSNLELLTYNGTLDFNGGSTPDIIGGIYATSYVDTEARDIANGVTKTIDLGATIPEVYLDSVYKSIYYNWFGGINMVTKYTVNSLLVPDPAEFIGASYIELITGVDTHNIYEVVSVDSSTYSIVVNGILPDMESAIYRVGYSSVSYFASTYYINKCLHSRISKLAISSCNCNNRCTEKLYEAVMLYMAIQPNMDLGKYQKAQDIITYLTNYCNDGCCNC